ncbi:hypothetical protein BZG35_00480 [Brevundimonas sp. LM2]|uniref:hypothetical protein n=1 Tax=Brevundimonas sp. LM2 TaxID=1938605 RepID=UPI000983BE47|nr:hypothetical protein [Brevundimonas sp. LM2]AQR60297.1 hypothetical protein BZG35_00480 [Brevundimonas sp. LM2]
MLRFKPLILGLLLALISVRADAQVLAPPAQYDGPSQVEGYDTRTLFQRWVMWVERSKGEALEAALAEVETPEGMRRHGSAIMEARASGDQGLALVADILIFCPSTNSLSDTRGCYPQMRDITIPASASAGGYGADTPLSSWIREQYDPVALVQALKAADVPPDADAWRTDLAPVFAGMASPLDVLRSQTQTRTVDGRTCPALVTALEAVEGRMLEWRIDLLGVAEDTVPPAPRPHATRWRYRLQFFDEDDVGIGAGSSLEPIVSPVFEAGQACRQAAG